MNHLNSWEAYMDSGMRKTITIVAILFAVVVAIGFILPGTASISRSTKISASPQLVYASLNNLHLFEYWSPWNKDPNSIHIFEGPARGKNAKVTWTGKSKGNAVIINSQPNEVQLEISFFKQGGAHTQFKIEADGNNTLLTWTLNMELGLNIYRRYIAFFQFEGLMEPTLKTGLNNIKKIVEKNAQ